MPATVETELKYDVLRPGAGDRYLEAGNVGGFTAVGGVTTKAVEDRYVDTADSALAQKGWAARFRTVGGSVRFELKSRERMRGLHKRRELDGPADPAAPASEWPKSKARDLVVDLAGPDARLQTLVSIRQLRRSSVLRTEGAEVELSLDSADVVGDGGVVESFETLEAELLSGDEGLLATLALVFDADAWLRPSSESKLERALGAVARPALAGEPEHREDWALGEALRGEGEAPKRGHVAKPKRGKADAGGLALADCLGDAGVKIVRQQYATIRKHEEGVRSGADPEDVHQMRVATRRSRAALRLFRDSLDRDRTRRVETGLRGLARRLGAVRDLDVLLGGLETYAAALPEDGATGSAGLEPIRSAWVRERDKARGALLAELESDRYRQLGKAVDALVKERPARARVGDASTVRDRAGSTLLGAWEEVHAFQPVIAWADLETLHRLRISAKRLRYALEFFRAPLGPEAGPLIDRVTRLQDHLGSLHDAAVGGSLARKVLAEPGRRLAASESRAIAAYLRSREREVARLRRSLPVDFRAAAGPSFRRALLRSIAWP